MANFFEKLAEATTDLKEHVRQLTLRLNAIADPTSYVYSALKTSILGAQFNDTAQTVNIATLPTADIEILAVGKGIIMKSPNGNRWRLTPSNAGAAVFTAI